MAKWKPNKKGCFNELKVCEIVAGKHRYLVDIEPGTGFILNRQEFIYQLGEEAKKLGIDCCIVVNAHNSITDKTARLFE